MSSGRKMYAQNGEKIFNFNRFCCICAFIWKKIMPYMSWKTPWIRIYMDDEDPFPDKNNVENLLKLKMTLFKNIL